MSFKTWVLVAAAGFSSFVSAANDLGKHPTAPFNVFHPIHPTVEQVGNYSTGLFMDWYNHRGWRKPFWYSPPSPYECRYRDSPLLATSSFSCEYTSLQTPEDIFEAKNRIPECLHVENIGDISYERLQWATWTHSCWARDNRAHKEREIVLWQHDIAVYHVNREIALYIAETNAHIAMRVAEQDAKIQMLNEEFEETLRELEKSNPKFKSLKIKDERQKCDKKIKALKRKLDLAGHKKTMEREFWVKSWPSRSKIPQLDHLVGPYFERRMRKDWQHGFDWLGYGEPNPKEPLYPYGLTWTPEGMQPTYLNQSIDGSGILVGPQIDRTAVLEAAKLEAAMIKTEVAFKGPLMVEAANFPLPEAIAMPMVAGSDIPAPDEHAASVSKSVSSVEDESTPAITPAPTFESAPLISERDFWGDTSAPWRPPSPEEWSSMTRRVRSHPNYVSHLLAPQPINAR